MYKKKTVFVIGAGCSAEFKLPIGRNLRNLIFDQVGGANNSVLTEAISRSGIPNAHVDLVPRLTAFARGLHTKPSIDQYLHFHRDDERFVGIGKAAIASVILTQERQSTLASMSLQAGMKAMEGTWLSRLFEDLNDGIDLATVGRSFENISFICFNYDRCIEVGLYGALRFLTGLPSEQVADVMDTLKVWHPYGTVGKPDFRAQGSDSLRFGFPNNELTAEDIIDGARGLRTFTEGMDDDSLRSKMQFALTEAEQVVFLGFSFLDQNMQVLRAPARTWPPSTFLCTYGMSGQDIDIAIGLIGQALSSPGNGSMLRQTARQLTCTASQFMNDFGKYLQL